MADNLPTELKKLFKFYIEQRNHPPEAFTHVAGLIPSPSFFSVAKLQQHLGNPLLSPDWVQLHYNGEMVPLDTHTLWKTVQGRNLQFIDKQIVEDCIHQGGAVVLEGLDILEPTINAFAQKVDASMPCALSNCVAFFSQKANEAYAGHRDSDDVLVIHLAGEKLWHIFKPQQRRYFNNTSLTRAQMGELLAEVVMRPGDALFMPAGVPHIVKTTGDHSLHLAFDLIDRTPNVESMNEAACKHYNNGGENPHVPPSKVIDHYIRILQSPGFQQEITSMTEQTRMGAAQFRERIGRASVVRALSKYIPKEQK